MTLRCCAAGMLKAEKQFRRVNGHLHLAALRQALDLKTEGRHTSTIAAYGRSPKFYRPRDILGLGGCLRRRGALSAVRRGRSCDRS